MGLFDIFKQKKETDPLDSVTEEMIAETEDMELDVLMEKAIQEPAYKSAFYSRVLTDEIIVISVNVNVSEGYQYLEVGTSVEIYSLPDGSIPLFTSIDRIFDNGIVTDDVEFLKMSGADLFSVALGETFIVNPYSEYKNKISASVAERLLDGRM
ncbi:SseB family protein [Pedobacter hartonius]|uniref:SseB protein N-terminal domain-containing protein n=1 Tax=Pedobacter hartonius TaxID=425514 RepID=A0A1H4H1P2_9SPHI|nr:SseB family protein [Pedobacter hartonius]SEB14922.1 SseB protein N-terminal domain-containing protein [Pedobacter hartonius]